MLSFPSSMSAGSPIAESVEWVRDLLTGSVGTSVAALAIAWVGFSALQGRISWREGARVVLGCFILFGSPVIVAGLFGIGRESKAPEARTVIVPPTVAVPTKPPQFDPYAGASVPNH
jgi:type IV secretion system protein VirB2